MCETVTHRPSAPSSATTHALHLHCTSRQLYWSYRSPLLSVIVVPLSCCLYLKIFCDRNNNLVGNSYQSNNNRYLLTPRSHITWQYYRHSNVFQNRWFPKCAPRIPRDPRPFHKIRGFISVIVTLISTVKWRTKPSQYPVCYESTSLSQLILCKVTSKHCVFRYWLTFHFIIFFAIFLYYSHLVFRVIHKIRLSSFSYSLLISLCYFERCLLLYCRTRIISVK
jgi:hypothetical protein